MVALPAVTYERLKQAIETAELNYDVDPEDGEIRVGFENCIFFLNLNDFTWRTSMLWRGGATDKETYDALVAWVHASNSQRSFPKVYIVGQGTEEDPGRIAAETNCVIKAGLTDEQLNGNFNNAMGSLFSMLGDLEAEFDQLVNWSEEG